MIDLALQKYFDPWKIVTSRKIELTQAQILALHKCGNPSDMEIIGRLIRQLKNVRYARNDEHAAQVKKLYDAYNSIPDHSPLEYVKNPPIRKITIELSDRSKIVISDKTLLWNICYLGFRFFKYFYQTFIKKNHTPNARRKGKGINLQTSKVALAKRIIKYLTETTNLNKNEIGDRIITIYKTVGLPLEYKDGKTAYDSITRAR